ncbi:gliding motility-associated C-terminal domain-containing protein [Mucilaginibacter gilvus]|uniref:Gliding motility-associated C-terminal domain-containing protein n=2 Tax=Mucilaginibacter gilvus TaxID=2305909 RepID=A0A3S4Y268_9SPHI|nr:gliding motility-associated C-terminal domain-containing protein [Mucilaginibacter gilvus]
MGVIFKKLYMGKWLCYCSVLSLLLSSAKIALAEGSKELAANGGNRAYLLSTTTTNPSYPFPTLGTMKVYVKAGETIYVGSSAQGQGSGSINMRAPDGSVYTSGTSSSIGFIGTRAQELAGPLPNAGGYQAFTKTVIAGQEGIWEIDFISPTDGTDFGGNPPAIAVNAQWIQPTNRYVAAFDVSVRNSTNTAFLTGRVFTNVLSGILGTFNVGFNAILSTLTKDGYRYTLDNNGQAGNGFTFFVNNKGFRNADGTASYKSVDNTNNPNAYSPVNNDTPSDITHKIFFNTPSADLPAVANTPGGGTTWLINVPVVPALTNIGFTGADGMDGVAGTALPGGKIKFTATGNGTYAINIDVNHNNIFTDAIDRQLTGTVNAGGNQVSWDGLDGAGNQAKPSAASYAINITASLFAAEVHFPFFDVERNLNGILLTRINGSNSPDNTIYWDDSDITEVGVPSNPVKNTTGLSSLVNGHKWGKPAANINDADDFGNERSIDTWAYVISPALKATVDIRVQSPDPSNIKVPNIITPNSDGKNDVFEVIGIASYPGSRLLIFNRWGNQVYKSEDYHNNWDGTGLADGTYYYLLELNTGADKPTVYKGWIYINRR